MKFSKRIMSILLCLNIIFSLNILVNAEENIVRYDFSTNNEHGEVTTGTKVTASIASGSLSLTYKDVYSNTVGITNFPALSYPAGCESIIIRAKLPVNVAKIRFLVGGKVFNTMSVDNAKEEWKIYKFTPSADFAGNLGGTTQAIRFDIIGDVSSTNEAGLPGIEGIAYIDWLIVCPESYEVDDSDLMPDFGELKFYQRSGNEEKELEYNAEQGFFIADDGIAKISLDGVMPSSTYDVVERFVAKEHGRIRVFGNLISTDEKGGNNIVRIYKNNELIREQLCLSGETAGVDVRFIAEVNDVIDVVVSVDEYAGHNYAEWNLSIANIAGPVMNSVSSTIGGSSYSVLSQQSLSEYISGAEEGTSEFYVLSQGIKYPMVFNPSSNKWVSSQTYVRGVSKMSMEQRGSLEDYINDRPMEDLAYITSKSVGSTSMVYTGSDTLLEIPITSAGTMLIDGCFKINGSTDGELVTVYLNDNVVWSNRIGGNVSMRWDEPYDTKYFINDIETLINVKQGDVLTFAFNKWRKRTASESIDISSIQLKYIEPTILSKTTSWKLKNSIVIDTKNGMLYNNGSSTKIDVSVQNGSTYIPVQVAKNLFGGTYSESVSTVPLRATAEENGKNVIWTEDSLVIIHNGIEGMYTWNELNEISTLFNLKGGVLFE